MMAHLLYYYSQVKASFVSHTPMLPSSSDFPPLLSMLLTPPPCKLSPLKSKTNLCKAQITPSPPLCKFSNDFLSLPWQGLGNPTSFSALPLSSNHQSVVILALLLFLRGSKYVSPSAIPFSQPSPRKATQLSYL